jgi:hypothetical protein
MRRVAIQVMRGFAEHHPYLAGATWNGTATRAAPIDIDLFTDEQKLLELMLINRGTAFTTVERAHFNKSLQTRVPVLRFQADDYEVRLSLFSRADERQARTPDAAGAVERGNADGVAALLASADEKDRLERFLTAIR